MPMEQERREIVRYLNKLLSSGLTRGTGGNISVYRPSSGLVAISPSGMEYEILTDSDITLTDLDGNIKYGSRAPSTELPMHLAIYKARPDVRAIVHCHSVYSCVLASLGEDLPPCSYLLGLAGGAVKCTEYIPCGTPELAASAAEGLSDRAAVILGGHGLVTVGSDLRTAFTVAEQTEFCAEVYCKAKAIGTPNLLSDAHMAELTEKFKTYLK